MYSNGTGNASTSPRTINGRSLVHRHLNARQKAAIVAQILEGEVAIKLTARQLAQLLGVSAVYIRTAAKFSPAKRCAIASGKDSTSFTTLLSPSTRLLTIAA